MPGNFLSTLDNCQVANYAKAILDEKGMVHVKEVIGKAQWMHI